MSQPQLPLAADTLYNELEGARAILAKWVKVVGEDGLPGVDRPANPAALEAMLRELCGELTLVSGRCDTLVEVLGSALL